MYIKEKKKDFNICKYKQKIW